MCIWPFGLTHFPWTTHNTRTGDKAAAKALGEEGRNLNALMRARHRQAALTIFAMRNPSDARIYEEGIIDLHGLHVQEAIETLEELLPDIYRVSGQKEVLVITGTGRHSGAISKHQSRLFPALDDHLREVAAAMARKQSARAMGGASVSADAAAAALFSHVADPAGHKGGFRVKVNRRLMEYWGVEL
jgi:DNA-nicking Smr family endonuclease